MNPLDVLAALLAVDGHGSGLDADLLDGLHGSEYVQIEGAQAIVGQKTFTISPLVPDPVNPLEAANKEYVDAQIVVAEGDVARLSATQTFTGKNTFSLSPAVPTPTQPADAANKDYVDAKVAAGGGGTGTTDHSVLTNRDMAGQHPTAAITGLDAALAALAPLASPALTGTPTAPTAPAGTSTTQLATTAFVAAALQGPGTSGKTLQATITSSQTWTVPANLQGQAVDVYLVGGGAGGRGGQASAGGTGGGGGYCILSKGVVLSAANYPLVVGTGGGAGASAGGNGTDGLPTSGFGVTANGGKAYSSTAPYVASGGSGGGDGGSGANGGDGGWGGRAGTGVGPNPGGGNDTYTPINPYDGRDYGGGGGGGAPSATYFAGRGGGNSGGSGGGGASTSGFPGVNGRGGGGGGGRGSSGFAGSAGGSGVILIYA